MTTDNARTKTRDPERTRSSILDAALNAFARKGYHDTRLDEIADESHTSKGSIYFYFPNKERLFLALVDQFANLLERRITEAISGEETAMAKVEAALEACLATFGKYRRQAKVLLVQASGLGNTFEMKRIDINERFAGLIEQYLQEAVEQGEIAPIDTAIVAHAWMGAIYNLVIRWVYTGDPEPQRIVNTLVPTLLRSVGYVRGQAPAETP
ncbi:MAG: TetR/AcrR family transcriptional regulator [Caldilineaceae bacterium]|nr:TetR/AcrR family transcriptional regulator [Caldilineaceae bacterium]MCB9137430.1 TetR/AcrR family transcriptional regulator [Caldilineaceae bacterium]